MDFKPGQRVKVVQRGTLKIGGLTLTDNTFEGVTVVRKNPDGTYQVRGIIQSYFQYSRLTRCQSP